jgi:hypothetical protein
MRRLDLALLDTTTWPEFVWDWLQLMRDRHLLALHYGSSGSDSGGKKQPRQRRPRGGSGSEGNGESEGSEEDEEGEGAGGPAVAPKVKAEAEAAVEQLEAATGDGGRKGGGGGGTPAARAKARKRSAPKRVDEAALVWTEDEEEGHLVTRRRGPIGRRKAAPAAPGAPHGGARPPASAAASRGVSEEPERGAPAEGGATGAAPERGATPEKPSEARPGPAAAAPMEPAAAPAGTPPPPKRRKLDEAAAAPPRGAPAPRSPPPALLAAMRAARPGPASARVGYWALSVRARAAVLARMCEDLLNSGLARTEIDKREGAGLFHAGKGGAGGAFAMLADASGGRDKGGGGEDGGGKDDAKPAVSGRARRGRWGREGPAARAWEPLLSFAPRS